MKNKIPVQNNGDTVVGFEITYCLITAKSKDPVEPYNKAIPNNKNPVEKAPIKKYFNEASLEEKSFLRIPAKIYKATDIISMPINSIDKLWNEVTKTPPSKENNNRV